MPATASRFAHYVTDTSPGGQTPCAGFSRDGQARALLGVPFRLPAFWQDFGSATDSQLDLMSYRLSTVCLIHSWPSQCRDFISLPIVRRHQ